MPDLRFLPRARPLVMCKTKMAVQASSPTPRTYASASDPAAAAATSSSRLTLPSPTPGKIAASSSSSVDGAGEFRLSSSAATFTATSTSSASLSSLHLSLPELPLIYDFSELRSSTNNFLLKPSSSSPPTWHSSLRGKPVSISQRTSNRSVTLPELRDLLSLLSKIHLSGITRLLGASLPPHGDSVFLVYERIDGAGALSDLLRNARSPDYTVLSTWMSRVQVLTDVAHALDYIHNYTRLNVVLVHNRIHSGNILVTEPGFSAKLCDFGAAQICGDEDENSCVIEDVKGKAVGSSKQEDNNRRMQFQGVRGYMSPEYVNTGVATRKSDVYAFGVLLLELLSGEEPMKFRFDKNSGDFVRTTLADTARAVVEDKGRVRGWMDRRLRDSFPEEVVEKVMRLGLECVEEDPEKRPDMSRVAGKVSKLFVQSESWFKKFKLPTEISVSLAPR